ncbi:MAG: RNA polymerase sigma factor [Bradymonadaceae bacterium]
MISDEFDGDEERPEVEPTLEEVPQQAIPLWQRIALGMVYWPTVVIACILVIILSDLSSGPFAVVVVFLTIAALKLFSWGWKVVSQREFRAGFVVGALSWFYGPLYGVVALGVLVGALATNDDGSALLQGCDDGLASDESYSPPPLPEAPNLFAECVEKLYREHNGYVEVDRAVRATSGVLIPVARDLVHDAVIRVCTQYKNQGGLRNVGPYFQTTLKNLKYDHVTSKNPLDSCTVQFENHHSSHRSEMLERIRIRRAMCSLSASDQQIIGLKVEGTSTREIARKVGKNEGATRRALSRAIGRFDEAYKREGER